MKGSSEISALVRAARRTRARTRREAAGRCFDASLELALLGRRLGLELDLVRWKVRGDDDYSDHWAVRLDAGRVLDPTRIQVDGCSRLISDIDDYPANFLGRACYPASLFIDRYEGVTPCRDGRLPATFMLSCARAMFRFEAMRGLHAFWPASLAWLFGDLAKAHVLVLRASLLGALTRRRAELARRLASR